MRGMIGLLVLLSAAMLAASEPVVAAVPVEATVEASCGSDFSYISRGGQIESTAGELFLRTGNPKGATTAILAPKLVPGATISGVAFSYRYITGYGPTGVGANFSVLVAGVNVYSSPDLTNYSYSENKTRYSPPIAVAAPGLDITVPAKGGSVELLFHNNDRNLQMLLPLRFELTCAGPCVQEQVWQPPTPPTVVFAAGDVDSDGVESNCFRIPTLVKAPDGELIAFAEVCAVCGVPCAVCGVPCAVCRVLCVLCVLCAVWYCMLIQLFCLLLPSSPRGATPTATRTCDRRIAS